MYIYLYNNFTYPFMLWAIAVYPLCCGENNQPQNSAQAEYPRNTNLSPVAYCATTKFTTCSPVD